MSNRFGRDTTTSSPLYSYSPQPNGRSSSPSKTKPKPRTPLTSYAYPSSTPPLQNGSSFSAYPADAGFRSATPNSRGQYSAAVLDELESQNEDQVGVLSGKVRELKNLTHLIGAEIRDSSALADKMNDQFENSRIRLRGTMNRMLRMAEKTGVGWRVWVGFFAFVVLLFWYVWLF